jgi:O-6-methylguanine DNA methyltransferase
MKKLYTHNFDSSIGRIHLASTDRGLAIISIGKNGKRNFDSAVDRDFKGWELADGGNENKKAENQLSKYLSGKLKRFNLKLDVKGTPFQLKALKKIATIPYGEVRTYGQIAKALGSPKASRAVGNANARNRLPIVIPCHRVIAANGLGGYGGGLSLKRHLLTSEGIKIL